MKAMPLSKSVEYRDLAPHGWPGYRVGDDGSVWSCRPAGFRRGVQPWKRLRPRRASKSGHLAVCLCPGKKNVMIHQLVLLAFVGPCPPGHEVCHFPDRDPTNNRPTNLRWGTRKENGQDGVIHGTSTRGERHPQAKLTVEMVRDVKRRLAAGETYKSIAARLPVGWTAIAKIKLGLRWGYVTLVPQK